MSISLPSGYTQIEYLQNTNQNNNAPYIATQYVPTTNTKVVLDVALNATTLASDFFGIIDDDAKSSFRFHIGVYQSKWHFGVGTTSATATWKNFNSPVLDVARHTLMLQGDGTCSVDSVTDKINPNNTRSYNIPFYIFARNKVSLVDHGYIRLWSCKIYEGDTLTMNFVPCRDSNNVGYLYDTVGNQLYGNAGTGSFVLGPDVYVPPITSVTSSVLPLMYRRGVMMCNVDSFPIGYTKLEYIIGNGSSFFDTLIVPNTNMEFEAKWVKTSSAANYLYGSVANQNYKSFQAYLASTGYWRFGGGGTTITPDTNTTYISVQNATGVYWNGVKKSTYATITSFVEGTQSMLVFGRSHENGTRVASFGGNLYYLKIRENGVLIADFEPYINPQGVFGMYDIIRKKWFPSETTTPFSGVVPIFYDYLTFDGTAYIQTDLLLPENGSIRTYLYNMTKKQCGIFRALDNSNNMAFGLEVSASDATNHGFNIRYYKTSNDTTGAFAWGNYTSGQVYMTSSRCQVPGKLKTYTKGSVEPTKGIQLVYARNNASGNIFKGSISTFRIYGSNAQSVTSWAAFDGFTPVYTLQPCTYNGEAGMWCVETGTFYGNSAGSGTLTVSNS